MNLDFFRQMFEKYSNIKFYENPQLGAELFHADGRADGQTNRHNTANNNFAKASENIVGVLQTYDYDYIFED
jgi:hypothetical protein